MANLRLAQEIFNLIYPIGSVYISVFDINPSNYFGGTWERIIDGFIYCSYGEKNLNQGNLIGYARTNNTALTIDQIPSHYGHTNTWRWKL